jgi:putative ABC transport system permease protein
MSPARRGARLAALSPSIMKAALPQGRPDWQKRFLARKLVAKAAATGTSNLRQAFGEPLMVMMVMVAMVLLIACANITSLMLARATTREKEIAIRKALGASRERVTKQLLTESVLLSMCGAGVGLFLAKWGSALMVRNLSTGRQPIFLDTSLNLPVLGFTSVIAVLTGILMGLLPALRSTRVELVEAMKARATKTGLPSSRSRVGRWIVAAQVALSLLLLVAGGLLLRTFVKLMTLDPGFNRHNVLIVNATSPWWAQGDVKVPPERRAAVDDEILLRMRALPGVVPVARSFTSPIGEDNWWREIHTGVANAPTGDAASMLLNFISPGYLATLNMRLLSGRDFTEHDIGASQFVAIFNETAAHRFYPGTNSVGKQFRWGDEPNVVQIVGIVKDAKYQSMREESYPTVFLPVDQMPARGSADVFELRTSVAPDSLVPSVQRAISEVSPQISMAFRTLEEQVDDNLVQERLLAELAGFFSILALVLAMIGLYGTMSYAVTQRQVEFGIRMALGARRSSIQHLVMRDVALVLILGLAAGIGVSVVSVKVLNKLVYGLDPRDSATMIGAAVLLATMALAAGYLPARRATRVDPMVTLRYE